MLSLWNLTGASATLLPRRLPYFNQEILNTNLAISSLYEILRQDPLTHWGRMTRICVSKLNIIGSDNGLAPGRRQAIIWTNTGILLIGPLGTQPSDILVEIFIFLLKKIHFKMSSGKWWPFCLGLNRLKELPSRSVAVYGIEVLLRICLYVILES